MRFRHLLPLLVLAGCAAPKGRPPYDPPPPRAPQSVVLVSLDGFRADYLDRPAAVRLREIAARGVRARWMTPAFPTKTFPNHYTIVTGLHPEHHGIVSNTMRDAALGTFRISDTIATRDGRWWGGEPIWITAEKQGRRAASFFWPGSEAAIGGMRPTRWKKYDDAFPNAPRVDSVLAWLSAPDAPAIVTLYFSIVDHAGHDFGPDAPQTDSAIATVDSMMGRLVDGLRTRGLDDKVNVVIVSDHGMHETPKDEVIALDDYIALDDVDVIDWTPVGLVQPKPGKLDAVYAALAHANPHLKVYRRADVPERFHYRAHPRIPDLVLVADEGWSISTRSRRATWPPHGATHGWDHEAPSMRALFVAAGPAFKRGETVAPFQNIHVYDLLCRILGLAPAPNDGSPDSTRALLR